MVWIMELLVKEVVTYFGNHFNLFSLACSWVVAVASTFNAGRSPPNEPPRAREPLAERSAPVRFRELRAGMECWGGQRDWSAERTRSRSSVSPHLAGLALRRGWGAAELAGGSQTQEGWGGESSAGTVSRPGSGTRVRTSGFQPRPDERAVAPSTWHQPWSSSQQHGEVGTCSDHILPKRKPWTGTEA